MEQSVKVRHFRAVSTALGAAAGRIIRIVVPAFGALSMKHEPTGFAHDAVDLRQAEPCALSDRFRREERFHGARAYVLAHAAAAIFDGDFNIGALAVDPAHPLQAAGRAFDFEHATVRHRIARIHCEVQQRELELIRVAQHSVGIRRDAGANRHDGPTDWASKSFHAVNNCGSDTGASCIR